MITFTKSCAKKIAFIFILTLSALVFFGSPAQANNKFEIKQRELFKESSENIAAMGGAVDGILNVYIGADDDVYWNDPAITANYRKYLENLVKFNQGLDKVWNLSGKTLKRQRKSLANATRSGKRCRAVNQKRALAASSFNKVRASYKRALRKQNTLNQKSKVLADWALGTGAVTDGYLDGAVYDFGTKDEIYAPPTGSVPFVDPYDLQPLIDAIYEYSASTNPIYMSSFYKYMDGAIRAAKRC